MRIYLILLTVIGLLTMFSCQNERTTSSTANPIESEVMLEDAEEEIPLPALPYVALFDEASEQMELHHDPNFDQSKLHVDSLIALFKIHYPEIDMLIADVAGETISVSIPDATYLTQQMGSSGAKRYLVEVTYAFTEISGISGVNFQFEEGDHAIPGIYTRDSFKDDNVIAR